MFLIKKIVDYFILLLFAGMILIAVAIYVSNKTYPGSPLYSAKLKFEGLILTTSWVLNKQVDVSMSLVTQRSDEATKTIAQDSSNVDYVQQTLDRLDAQMVQTADSINQISDPVQKKQAAVKYIAQLNQVSTSLNQQRQSINPSTTAQPAIVNGTNTGATTAETTPASTSTSSTTTSAPTVSQQIDNTQQTIQQTINQMTDITASSSNVIPTMTPVPTIAPSSTPVPTQPVINQTAGNSDNVPNNHKFLNNGD